MNGRYPPAVRGVTLVEMMIGLLVLTGTFVAISSVFTSISKAILVNKTKTLAVSLAQEKIESLKSLTYFRLLVTTSVAPVDTNFPGNMYYDNGTTRSYYPEETLSVGDVTFKRRTFVEYLRQDGADFIGYPTVNWTSNDLGIKRVTVYVVWQEGREWKKVELRNLRNNPNRAELEYEFRGIVSSANTGNLIANALVDTEQNPSFYSYTDMAGAYSFKVQPGTYTLRVTATGYYTQISTPHLAPPGSGSLRKDFALIKRATGTAFGTAYIRNHLLITQVVASTHSLDGDASVSHEFVELFNPTTYEILIASRVGPGTSYNVFFVTVSYIDENDSEANSGQSVNFNNIGGTLINFRSSSPYWNENTSTISIRPNRYFLIANVSTVTVRGIKKIADAYYSGNRILTDSGGGIRVTGIMGINHNGRTDWHDGIGWSKNSGAKAAPSKATEGTGYSLLGGIDELTDFLGTFYRIAIKTSDSANTYGDTYRQGTMGIPVASNVFDRNMNGPDYSTGGDFDYYGTDQYYISASSELCNSDFAMPPIAGTPAVGASLSANDGLSPTAYVQTYGTFTILNISTGIWNVTISTGGYTRDIASMTVTAFSSTWIPNGITGPTWEFANNFTIGLSSSTSYGYISGTVRDALQRPLSGATISVSGANNVTTNAQGRYRVNIEPTTAVLVMATKSGFSTESAVVSAVNLGMENDGVDFTLVDAGRIKGFVSTNGQASGVLPGVPVVAMDLSSTTVFGSAISGADGFFYINSITTGSYIVSPQLEAGEASVPGILGAGFYTVTVNPQVGWSTFTISNAFGDLNGVVGLGSSTQPITTGVLIVASTVPINTAYPPDANSNLRNGTVMYYSVSSDASGGFELPVRGGFPYYIYGWYTSSVDVFSSTTTKKTPTGLPVTVDPGASVTKHIIW